MASTPIVVTAKVAFDIQTIVDLSSMEVSFWGRVKRINKRFRIWEILIPYQKVGPAYVSGGDGLTELCKELTDTSDINCMCHSHVNMGVFFSGPDQTQLDDLGDLGMPFAISMVFNKERKYRATCKVFEYEGAVIPSLKIEIDHSEKWEDPKARREALRLELERKVTQETSYSSFCDPEEAPTYGWYEEPAKIPTEEKKDTIYAGNIEKPPYVKNIGNPSYGIYNTPASFIPRSQFCKGELWVYQNKVYKTEEIPELEKAESLYVYGAHGSNLTTFKNLPEEKKHE